VHEVERRLRVTEPVIKFLTVRTDEELKRLDKIKKLRDAKKKVSAQPAAAAPGSGRNAGGTGSGARNTGLGAGLVRTEWLNESRGRARLQPWLKPAFFRGFSP
jgi:hypothetical protein